MRKKERRKSKNKENKSIARNLKALGLAAEQTQNVTGLSAKETTNYEVNHQQTV
ncbi:hypothetical protein [uncultured Phocaeicola sp.]|uniref:hypothetical protein n=1 Tax=uncultured Phocaeicola sp. TaxID=990718 RepID=UPI0025F7F825|nr:hypothetical protein [uncultured Phocaeicola sp.]